MIKEQPLWAVFFISSSLEYNLFSVNITLVVTPNYSDG